MALGRDGQPRLSIRDAGGAVLSEFVVRPGPVLDLDRDFVRGLGQVLVERKVVAAPPELGSTSPLKSGSSYTLQVTGGADQESYELDVRTEGGFWNEVAGIVLGSDGTFGVAEDELQPGVTNSLRLRATGPTLTAYSAPLTLAYDPGVTPSSPNQVRQVAAHRSGTSIVVRWGLLQANGKKFRLYFRRSQTGATYLLTPVPLSAASRSHSVPDQSLAGMAGVFFLTQSADGGPETGESIDVELGAPGGGDPGPDPGGPGPPDPAARQFTSLYQHRDHLGTIRVVTRATGAVERALDFYPFGTLLGASGAGTAGEPRHQFTGHERDEATGLDYMQARFHDSTLASFLSVDPGPARPASPQSWNRYAYVLNNPLTLVDPSGMVPRAAGSGGARSSYVRVPGYRADGTGAVGSMMEGFGLPQDVQDPHEKPATAAEPQVDVNSPSSELRGEIAQAAARQGAVEPICATPADLSVGPLTPDLASLQNAVFNLMSDPAAQTTEVFVELGKDAQGTWQPLSSGTLTPTGGNIDLVTGPEYSAYAVIHNHLGNGCPTSQKDVDTAKSFERFVAPAPVLSLVVYEQGVVRYDGSAEAWRVEGMRWR